MPRRSTLQYGPAVVHHSARRRCDHTAIGRLILGSAIPRLACARHRPPRTAGLSIRVEVRSRVQVHTRWQPFRNAIVSHQSRTAEIQPSQACGTNETPECSSGMETICETRTICGTQAISKMEITCGTPAICGTERISEMETIICDETGKRTFSLTAQAIGTAIGTATATTGGMATNALSSMERG